MSRGPKMILVSGGYDHTIRFWDVSNGSMTKQLQACTPTCSPHFFWHGRGTVPAVLRACCSTLHRPAHAAATLGQGPLRACALTSTGGLAVPRLADQRAADFARCAPGIGLAGSLHYSARACMRARTHAAREGGKRVREWYEHARARAAMRAREAWGSAVVYSAER